LANNNTEINVRVTSQHQETEIIKEREKILKFLRTRLQNSHLTLKTDISQDKITENTDAITSTEILKVMMIKNPALAKLRSNFNLELE
jgi:DNA polymerase-3 subunit gamma/tau